MTCGETIRQLREKKGMSQSDLAKAVGYKTRSSIAKIETGDSDPSQKMLVKIANVLEVSPGELIHDTISFDITNTANAILKANEVTPMSDARKNLLRLLSKVPEDKIDLLARIVQSVLEDARKGS